MVTFKVGDVVRVVNGGKSESGRRLNGQVGTIIEICASNGNGKFCSLDIERFSKGGVYLSELALDIDPNDLCEVWE